MSYLEFRQPVYYRRDLGAVETPDIKTLPWDIEKIDKPPTEEELRKAKSAEQWDKASLIIGLLGGTLGIILSWRALKGG